MPRKELNVKNLAEGMVVKNYIKMCELLGQPVCSGQSKKCQIRTWERYFDYHKEGQKFMRYVKNTRDFSHERFKMNLCLRMMGESLELVCMQNISKSCYCVILR